MCESSVNKTNFWCRFLERLRYIRRVCLPASGGQVLKWLNWLMFGNYKVIFVTKTKGFPPVPWDYITQANIAQKVCVNYVLLLEFCKRQELSFLSLSRMSGKVFMPTSYHCLYKKKKNRFSTDSDLMIIPQDLFFEFFLCTCCVLVIYSPKHWEHFSRRAAGEGAQVKFLTKNHI